jgi:hypothetical protein
VATAANQCPEGAAGASCRRAWYQCEEVPEGQQTPWGTSAKDECFGEFYDYFHPDANVDEGPGAGQGWP